MTKYLVIGDPVGHSRSPGMQNAAFEACGLGRPYGVQKVSPDELPEFFQYARKNLLGVNITVPHKIAAFSLADELTERAARCGSVNTLKIDNGKIVGDSTDGIGLERALAFEFDLALAGKNILFFGAGGAARATAVYFGCADAASIEFVNRTAAHAQALTADIRKNSPGCATAVIGFNDPAGIAAAIKRATVIIQATSLGLKESDPPPFDLELLSVNPQVKIFDTIYRETPLQRRAKELGISVANGKEMLIRQGAASFEWWTNISAPLDEMRRGFDQAIISEIK